MKKPSKTGIFIIILIIQLLFMGYYGLKKEGYYIDELWSYGLANGYYEPFLQDDPAYLSQWHNPSFFNTWLTVQNEHRFAYDSVYYNQANDVHPPLYYDILHTLCSFFPNRFSNHIALAVNLLFFTAGLIVLYRISRLLLSSRFSLIPPLLYGFSCGAVNTVTYFRMYMLLTFFLLCFVDCAVVFILHSEKMMTEKKRLFFFLFFSAVCGMLTQYYFIIPAFFVTLLTCLTLLCKKEIKLAFAFGSTVLGSLIAFALLFPPGFRNMFFGNRSAETNSNLHQGLSAILQKVYSFFLLLRTDTFSNRLFFLPAFIVTCVLILVFFYRKLRLFFKTHGKADSPLFSDTEKAASVCLAATAVSFFLIAWISPEITPRYIYFLYPLFILGIVCCLCGLAPLIPHANIVFSLFFAVCVLLNLLSLHNHLLYLYPGYSGIVSKTKAENLSGVYLTKGDHLVIHNLMFLMQNPRSFAYPWEDDSFPEDTFRDELDDRIFLYVDIYYFSSSPEAEFAQKYGYTNIDLLYDSTFSRIYLLSR